MDEENAERMLAKAEQQLNRTERRLLNSKNPLEQTSQRREWFQSKLQRDAEKKRLALQPKEPATKNTNNNKKKRRNSDSGESDLEVRPTKKLKKVEKLTPKQIAERRSLKEVEKVSLVRAKFAKSQNKLNKLHESDNVKKFAKKDNTAKNKNASRFDRDLTDVSKKGAKRLR